MNFIGIDPGLNGGIAIIYPTTTVTFVMPVMPQGRKKVYNHLALNSSFRILRDSQTYAVIEAQHAMPHQGVVSMLSIGYGFGALKQCLVDFNIPHEVVPAQTWQKKFGISGRKGNTKTQALRICQDLFPDVNLLATERSKKPHEGIVDAVLLAEFARRKYSGKGEKR